MARPETYSNTVEMDTAATQRQLGALESTTVEQFQTIRTLAGSADSTFTFGLRAARPASGAQGDRFFATDRNCLFYYTGTQWAVVVGFMVGTNAARSGMSVDATDNGYFFLTNDQNKLWVVSGGAWVDLFTNIDATTQYKVNGTKVVGARGAAVADVASADATDLATVLTLANETKAQLNTLLARVRAATGHGLIG